MGFEITNDEMIMITISYQTSSFLILETNYVLQTVGEMFTKNSWRR